MGLRARKYFEKAAAIGGLRGKIRLASLARITSTEADSLVETPELIAKLERAMTTVEGEFKAPEATHSANDFDLAPPAPGRDDGAYLLRRHIGTFLELMSQRSLFFSDVNMTFRRLTEAAATTLEVTRAGIWFVDKGLTKIISADVFDRQKSMHSSGEELRADEFPSYFSALREERTIAAHDCHTDPRTSCFSTSYFKPLGVTSTLDVPVWVNNEMVGVVCHEHTGPRRTWNSDEENFAYLMANFAALVMERERSTGRSGAR